ncbi:MAG: DUF559 domain-containing protein [Bacteroidota bacterium]|nr:DUF559 domain-containing protein [Bacteroidota bacterium]
MSLTRDPRLNAVAKQYCRKLRKQFTKSEDIFWQAVRNRKLCGNKFYRQYPIFFDLLGIEVGYRN